MDEKPVAAAKVQITKNGPYRVSGNLPLSQEVIGADTAGESVKWEHGQKYPLQEKYVLCRCGHSANKPFCDGTHAKIGFAGTEPASRKPYREQVTRELSALAQKELGLVPADPNQTIYVHLGR